MIDYILSITFMEWVKFTFYGLGLSVGLLIFLAWLNS